MSWWFFSVTVSATTPSFSQNGTYLVNPNYPMYVIHSPGAESTCSVPTHRRPPRPRWPTPSTSARPVSHQTDTKPDVPRYLSYSAWFRRVCADGPRHYVSGRRGAVCYGQARGNLTGFDTLSTLTQLFQLTTTAETNLPAVIASSVGTTGLYGSYPTFVVPTQGSMVGELNDWWIDFFLLSIS